MSLLDTIGVWIKPKKHVSPLRECQACHGTNKTIRDGKVVKCPYCFGGMVRIKTKGK